MTMHPTIIAVTERIARRSLDLRADYLKQTRDNADNKPRRTDMRRVIAASGSYGIGFPDSATGARNDEPGV